MRYISHCRQRGIVGCAADAIGGVGAEKDDSGKDNEKKTTGSNLNFDICAVADVIGVSLHH